MNSNNMKIEFVLSKPKGFKHDIEVVNKFIVSNNIPVGIITEAEYDEDKQHYKCKGVIWDKFIKTEFVDYNLENKPKLAGIYIGEVLTC